MSWFISHAGNSISHVPAARKQFKPSCLVKILAGTSSVQIMDCAGLALPPNTILRVKSYWKHINVAQTFDSQHAGGEFKIVTAKKCY